VQCDDRWLRRYAAITDGVVDGTQIVSTNNTVPVVVDHCERLKQTRQQTMKRSSSQSKMAKVIWWEKVKG